jgi:hypothetical protein
LLHLNYVTGFSDVEACFYIRISKDNKSKTGWVVAPVFSIGLDKRDRSLLEWIKSFFAVG